MFPSVSALQILNNPVCTSARFKGRASILVTRAPVVYKKPKKRVIPVVPLEKYNFKLTKVIPSKPAISKEQKEQMSDSIKDMLNNINTPKP